MCDTRIGKPPVRSMVTRAVDLRTRPRNPYHSPHKLRHGHTVHALKQAKDIADLKAISQNLMHSSITITDGVYGVLGKEDVATRIAGLTSKGKPNDTDLIERFKRFLREEKD